MASVSKVSILDYFNIVFEGENGKIESNCKACGTRIQAKRSVTSNFVTHLKRKHPAMYDDFVKRKDMKREGYSSACLHSFTTNGGNPRFTLPVTTGTGGGALVSVGGVGTLEGGGGPGAGVTKFDRHDPRQVLISEAIAKMIVHDLQSVSIVENQGFRELLQLLEPRYTPEPQHYIQGQLLPAYAYQAHLATRQAVASAHTFSLSLDLWRSQTQTASGYLGVTCHYLASDWQIRSALLACLPLTCSSSASRVLADFDEVCHSHGVSGRAFCVVADPFPATSAARPCCLPGFLLPPVVTNGQDDDPTDQVLGNGNNAEQWISNGHECNGEEEDWGESWEQGLGVCRVDCFSRSLEQCVREGLRSSPQISSTLTKVARFYNYITSAVPPEKLIQVFDGWLPGGTRNLHDTATDWAAQLKVLRRLLDSVEFLEEVSGPGEVALSSSERALLRELTDILEPFSEAWDMVHRDAQRDTQPDRHVSISLALPCVLGLRKHLSETSTPHCPALLLGLNQSLERLLAPILENPLYITATTLDPQFKLTWSSNPDWHKQVLLEELSKHSTASPPTDLNTDISPQSQTLPIPSPSPVSSLSRPCKLFSFIKQRPATQAKSLEQELSVYLHEEPTDEEALHYWRRKSIDFPLLAQVAKRAFTIPACDTVVENIFSAARRLLLPERGHVLPKNLETLIYLKANYKLLWT
ncbi:zinc finger BED domain-containing protein DAYSLEEPER isoform X1 [Poecilia reticulata]|uniref:zinc finger BED domain-containing protein DAYSLEEPER isoform X1 n=1 Tax=Poecilia reticulata TaxID=8081 RepID=UPI0004A4791A|nr:PREDICTED: zinc finger BED domain-containing protein DAYSLEEPER-like isoform X1 [Poecilia reticulata]